MQDFRLALRRLWARPGFAAVAIGTLALGIGANAAIFSVVRAVLLAPLPFAAPDRLARVLGYDLEEREIDNLSPADYLDFQRESKAFERMGAHGWVGSFTIGAAGGDTERVGGVNVTEGFFPTLGIQAPLGRVFTPADDAPGAAMTVMLSDGFWRRRFGGDPGIIGTQVLINARPATVVGVLPPSYRHIEWNPDRSADVFAPYGFDPAEANRGGHFIRAVGRLAPGASIEQANAELAGIAARLERDYPTSNHRQSVEVSALQESLVRDVRRSLVVLSAAVALVLLIACANLANLLLAAGTGRQREFAVRTAMGAVRRRLVAQLLTESLVLSGLGALAGLGLALWATRATALLAAANIPRAADVRIDGSVLGFVALAAVATAMLFGLVPALQLSKGALHDVLKEGGRAPGGVMRRRARESFIAVQVALAIVLLVGASLLVRSLWKLQSVPPGFAPMRLTAMDVSLPTAIYEEGQQIPFYQRLEERVRTMPGVTEIGAINILPLSANYDSRGIQVEDHPRPEGQGFGPQARSVTPGYFRAMGIPLVRGRLFEPRDAENAPLVVVISEAMAKQYWPDGEDPVGRRITFNSGIAREQQRVVGGAGSREVIGIVGDVHHLGLDEEDVPMFYTPHTQQPSYHTMTLVVRTSADVPGLVSAVRGELKQMDAGVPLYQARTIEQVLSRVTAQPRLRASLVALFAGLAFLLAALGVYGVVSYVVSQRTHEIGVRMSLGAGTREVVGLLLGDGMRPVLLGVAAGLAGAWMASRALTTLLYDVSPGDPISYAAAAAGLTAAALIATLIPARRALQVDPASSLRSE
jgi:putative ABC transport system permease protein